MAKPKTQGHHYATGHNVHVEKSNGGPMPKQPNQNAAGLNKGARTLPAGGPMPKQPNQKAAGLNKGKS